MRSISSPSRAARFSWRSIGFGRSSSKKFGAQRKAKIRRTLRLKERIRHQFRGAGVLPAADANAAFGKLSAVRPRLGSGLVLIGTSTGGPAALDVVCRICRQTCHGQSWSHSICRQVSRRASPNGLTGFVN